VNHVPDDAFRAIDALGRGLLRGELRMVETQLRTGLQVEIAPSAAEVAAGRLPVAFAVDGPRQPRLGEYGSFVETIVSGVETRLVAWGIDPPARYPRQGQSDGRHRYVGIARRPGTA
jgi:hypothetical protein